MNKNIATIEFTITSLCTLNVHTHCQKDHIQIYRESISQSPISFCCTVAVYKVHVSNLHSTKSRKDNARVTIRRVIEFLQTVATAT